MNKFFLMLGLVFVVSGPSFAKEAMSVYSLPVSFKNTDGESISLSRFKGKPVVITMTYSSCPYACPRIIRRIEALQKKSLEEGKNAHYVIVTFDPERDTPARLKAVQNDFNKNSDWFFLTGSESATRQLSMILGIRYQKNLEDGTISHDNKILILNDAGVIVKELNGLTIDPLDSI